MKTKSYSKTTCLLLMSLYLVGCSEDAKDEAPDSMAQFFKQELEKHSFSCPKTDSIFIVARDPEYVGSAKCRHYSSDEQKFLFEIRNLDFEYTESQVTPAEELNGVDSKGTLFFKEGTAVRYRVTKCAFPDSSTFEEYGDWRNWYDPSDWNGMRSGWEVSKVNNEWDVSVPRGPERPLLNWTIGIEPSTDQEKVCPTNG